MSIDLWMFYFRELKTASTDALAGKKITQEIGVDKVDKSLVANFEILNLVPEHSTKDSDLFSNRSEPGKLFLLYLSRSLKSNSKNNFFFSNCMEWNRLIC